MFDLEGWSAVLSGVFSVEFLEFRDVYLKLFGKRDGRQGQNVGGFDGEFECGRNGRRGKSVGKSGVGRGNGSGSGLELSAIKMTSNISKTPLKQNNKINYAIIRQYKTINAHKSYRFISSKYNYKYKRFSLRKSEENKENNVCSCSKSVDKYSKKMEKKYNKSIVRVLKN